MTEPAPAKGAALAFDKLFRTALIVVPIGVLGNIVFSLVATERDVLRSLLEFPREFLLLAVGLALLPWLMNTLRLYIWTRFFGYPISLRDAYQIILGMDLGAAVSPTAVGGGLFRWGMLVQRGVSPGAAASLSTLPTLEDGIFFAIALPLGIYLSASWDLPIFRQLGPYLQGNVAGAAAIVFSVLFTVWLCLRLIQIGGLGRRIQERSTRWLSRARRQLRVAWRDAREIFLLILKRGKGWFALSMTLTAIHWIARYSVISALVAFLGLPVDPILFWVLQWVVFSLMAMVPTPGAVGGAEAAFYVIYGAFLPERVIGIATAGWRFLTFYLQLGLAAILFTLMNMQRPWRRETQPDGSNPGSQAKPERRSNAAGTDLQRPGNRSQ
jgi:glycosyltransferase 2 family protein